MFGFFHAIVVKIALGFMSIALFLGTTTTPNSVVQQHTQDIASSTQVTQQTDKQKTHPFSTFAPLTQKLQPTKEVTPTRNNASTTLGPMQQQQTTVSPTQIPSATCQTPPCMSDADFIASLNTMKLKMEQNNPYLIQKNAIMDALVGKPTSDRLVQLPPDIQWVINRGDHSEMLLEAQLLNNQILDYNFKIEQQFQTQINNYLISKGLPVTQPIPIKTNCTLLFGTMTCYTS